MTAAPIDGGCPIDFPIKVGQDGKARATDDPHYGDTQASSCYSSLAAANAAGHRTAERFQVADVTKSIMDNQGYIDAGALKGLTVAIDQTTGEVDVTVKPSLLNETDALTKASEAGATASKAIRTTYPEAQSITVIVMADLTDQYGRTSSSPVVTTTVSRATGLKFDYDGLKSRILSDNKVFLCASDQYVIDPAVYVKIRDKGCLTGLSKG